MGLSDRGKLLFHIAGRCLTLRRRAAAGRPREHGAARGGGKGAQAMAPPWRVS